MKGESTSQAFTEELRRALAADEFVPFYQPIVDLKTRRTNGFEALVRRNHPERGLLLPRSFLTTVEEAGLLQETRQMLLDKASRAIVTWQRELGLRLDLYSNINAAEPSYSQFEADIVSVIHQNELDPSHLVLELDRAILLQEINDSTANALAGLSKSGVRMAIDDLLDDSTFERIGQLSANVVKLDIGLVRRAVGSAEGRQFVAAIVRRCGDLGILVLAEGIEEEALIEPLTELGCRLGQGFYFGRPVDAITMASGIGPRTLAVHGSTLCPVYDGKAPTCVGALR